MKTILKSIGLYLTVFLSIILLGCGTTTTTGTRIDNIPMYGQPTIQRPDVLKRADEDFIKQASDLTGGSREKASQALFGEGNRFMNERNLDFAMRRYNQSWLLNPNNYQPYWGFGQVMIELNKFDEAIQYLEKSLQLFELIDGQSEKPGLIATFGMAYSAQAMCIPNDKLPEKKRLFLLADKYFDEGTTLDPTHEEIWRRWAFSMYAQEDYSGAWEKVKQARIHNAWPSSPIFLRALEQKMPEPK